MCAFSTKLPVFVIRHVCHYTSGPFIMKVPRQRDDVERTVSQLGRIRLIHKDFIFASVHLLFWPKDAQLMCLARIDPSSFVLNTWRMRKYVCSLRVRVRVLRKNILTPRLFPLRDQCFFCSRFAGVPQRNWTVPSTTTLKCPSKTIEVPGF